MESALSNIIILDVSRDIAGSHACMLLGDMGASVVKVELEGNFDWTGEIPFHLWNRGKRSILLNFAKDGGRSAFEALVKSADVVVEDYLPSEAKSLGLDYETLRFVNDRLLYCAIPPFGEEGPLADKPGNDGVVAAYSALMGNQNGPDADPEYIKVPGPSCGAAFLASYAICAGLYVRETDGVAQKIEVSLLNGSITMQGSSFIRGPGMQDPEGPERDPLGVKPAYRLYQCKDDKWIFIACGNETFWGKFCIALGMEDFTVTPRFEGAPWQFTSEDNDLVQLTIKGKIKKQSQSYWLDFFDKNDVPASPANTRDDFTKDAQVISDNMMVKIDDPILGLTNQLGSVLSIEGMPAIISSPAPIRGEHGFEVLKELGYTQYQCDQLVNSGALLC